MAQKKKQPKCTGVCCEKFFLTHTPEEIWQFYEDWLLTGVKQFVDIDKIGPMVIPIEKREEGAGWYYTCKHWDKETMLCKIYAQRPDMCSGFPYMDPCKWCGWVNEEYIKEKEASVLSEGPVLIE